MKRCQATFCTPLKICQKWARFIRKINLYKFIENTLKIDNNGRNLNIVEKGNNFCNNMNMTTINVKCHLRLCEEGVTKIRRLRICFIRVYVFVSPATFNTVFFFLANETSFKNEFLLTTFFIDDQFFYVNLK
ncbi:unnamed protein product [Tenebrio molitor]|nr:unnamed protein product [Tenebrio molitor]